MDKKKKKKKKRSEYVTMRKETVYLSIRFWFCSNQVDSLLDVNRQLLVNRLEIGMINLILGGICVHFIQVCKCLHVCVFWTFPPLVQNKHWFCGVLPLSTGWWIFFQANMAGMNEEEYKKRAAFLKQQRDKLMEMKRREREKQLLSASSNQPARPASARAARR